MKVNLVNSVLVRLCARQTHLRQAIRIILFLLLALLLGELSGAFRQAEASIPVTENQEVPAPVSLSKDQILSDVARRVSPDFRVPSGLEKRVGFWFDIYTKYTADENVIHHVEYPWIILSVINTKNIHEDAKNRWARFHKIEKAVRHERQRIRKILLRLSKRKNLKNLTAEESKFVALLKEIPGKRSKVFRQAANNLRNQLGQKDFILSGLATSQKYFPYIETTFINQGLPVELTRLPLVESSFNVAAVSKVGASGIWQIMPSIGRKLLHINNYIDERNSPLKATTAAAKLLKQNYQILKTWPLALTAYNHGPGGLIRAQKKLKTNDIAKIVDDYSSSSFGFASSNFYCSFLAALFAEKYQQELFGEIPSEIMPEIHMVELPQSIKLKDLTAALNLDEDEIRNYNLDIKTKAFSRNRRLPKGYKLFVPAERKTQLETFLENLPQSVTSQDNSRRESKL